MNSKFCKYLGLTLRSGTGWLLTSLLVAGSPASLQAQFTFTTNNGAITITGYTGPGGVVTIPSSTNGFPVTSIGTNAFYGNQTLTSIVIPGSVNSILDGAFNTCESLTSVTLPDSVTNLGNYTFQFATSLISITIPNGVNSIGNGVFDNCTSLINVTIPGSVNSIGQAAFNYCTSLASVTIPGNLTSLGGYAFANSASLTNVYFGGNAPASFGTNVFINNPLAVILHDPGATGWGSNFEGIPTAPCSQCGSATPNPYNGFYWTQTGNSVSITNYAGTGGVVVIPTTIAGLAVTSIGDGAFFGNTNVTSVIIPGTVTNIGSGFQGSQSLTNVIIGNGVTSIGPFAFFSSKVINVVIGNSVTSIGFEAFQDCQSLATITIPNSVTTIRFRAFKGCEGMTSVTIPGGLTNIYADIFFDCKRLTNVIIGNGLTSLGYDMFWGCTSLTSIALPNSVTNIGDYAFAYTGLTNLKIPNSVISLGLYSFVYDTNLTSITIPSSVASIKYGAFNDCYSLTNVCFEGNAPGFGSNVFLSDPVPVIFYVSGGTGWGSNYEGIPIEACAQCGVAVIGTLQVNINPPCAVADGARWQVDGGAWQNSGVIVTNLAGGNHTVSFNNVIGWLAPSNQTVLVTFGTTNTVAGNFVETATPGVITWINPGGANANWSTGTNWDLNRAPTTNDIVLIPNTGGSACVMDVDATVAGLVIGDCAGAGSDGLNLSVHTLVVNGPITVKSNAVFGVNSGTLFGTSNTIISGVVGWTSGTLGGTLTLASNCVLNITANNSGKIFNGCLVTNYGTVNWSAATLYGFNGAVICNYGLWNALDDQEFFYNGGASTAFNNYGTFRKSGGAGGGQTYTLFVAGVAFNQLAGVLDVQNGTNGLELVLQGGGNFTGGFVTTNSSGLTLLSIGNFNINGTITSSNVFEDAALVGTNVIKGALTWQNGSWNGLVTVSSNSVVNINAITYNKTFNGCLVTNYGTVNWSGDQLNGNNGAVICNYGLWNAQDDQEFFYNGGAGTVFNNYGTFRKSGGTSVIYTLFTAGTLFNQSGGMLDVQTGNLVLQGTYSLTNGTMNFGVNNLTNHGALLLGSATLGGSLSVNVNGNFAPAIGNRIGIVGSSALNGTFSSVNVPAGISVVYTNNSVVLNVTGPVPVQLLDPQLVGTNLLFQFPTVSGQSYTIQRTDVLTSTNWVYYTNIIGSGALFQFQTPATFTPPQRFFRVRQP